MTESATLLVATKTVTLVLGGLITYLSYRAYRREGGRALRALAVGFGLVTVGTAAGGLGFHLVGASLSSSVTVNSIVTAVGFGVLVYSLYVEKRADRDVARAESSGRTGPGRHGAD